MKRRNFLKGITLLELLVYMVLFGIVASGVVGILISTLNYFKITSANSQLQQEAILVFKKLSQEIPEVAQSSFEKTTQNISVRSGQYPVTRQADYVMFASPQPMDGDSYSFDTEGNVNMKKWVCYYLDHDGDRYNLVRKEVSIPVADQSPTPNKIYATVNDFMSDDTVTNTKILAHGVEELTFDTTQGPDRINFRFTVDDTTDYTKPNKFSIETELFVRN
ncbi:MAG: PilW family protein [Vulcanimicrobiota bacterium]